ncbi:MAG: hypothetical protein IJI83_03245 [Oscillospiraceae bacterium]|nr:hypothetical protein [Oscillospiraceae bacterium]
MTQQTAQGDDRFVEIPLESYRNEYDRRIDVDVLKEKEVAFMVKAPKNSSSFTAVIYESHLTDYDTVSYTVYLERPDGTIDHVDGGDIDVRSSRLTIFDLLGWSPFHHSRKSRDIRFLDWENLMELVNG